jgi:hypothetical protein
MRLDLQAILLCGLLFGGPTLFGQSLAKAGDFSSYDGNAQFLPGAIVLVQNDINDGANNKYGYASGRFVKVRSTLPPNISNWTSFNWGTVDFLDQISRQDFESPSLGEFLPPNSKVKAFASVPANKGQTLLFMCYAVPPANPAQASTEEQRDIHIMMLTRGPFGKDAVYKKLDDVQAGGAYFGTMVVQRQAKETFVALYSDAGAVSHRISSIDIFVVRNDSTALAKRK